MKLSYQSTLAVASVLVFSSTVSATITLNNPSFSKPVIPNPSQGFNISYSLFGTEIFNPGKAVDFYLTPDNGTTLYSLISDAPYIECSSGPYISCRPVSQNQNVNINLFNMTSNTKALLAEVENACSPTSFKLYSRYYYGVGEFSSDAALMGTTKLSDWSIPSGTMTPTSTGVNISYAVRTVCASKINPLPEVGVYLTDVNFNALAYYGNLPILGPLGSNHSFNLNLAGLPAGSYNILLFADIDNREQESNENNNFGSFAFTVNGTTLQSSESEESIQVRTATPMIYLDSTPLPAYEEPSLSLDLPVVKGMKVIESHKSESADLPIMTMPVQDNK